MDFHFIQFLFAHNALCQHDKIGDLFKRQTSCRFAAAKQGDASELRHCQSDSLNWRL